MQIIIILEVDLVASLYDLLLGLLGFRLSPKMQLAIKASLSIVITFMLALYFGWASPTTGAITIALIASMDSLDDSLWIGMLRVVGTIIGATVGLLLIALFPQERMLFLIFASIGVTLFFYLARVYRGDTTIFFLAGMTIMLVFQNSNAQDAFIYGINRTFMTVMSIVIYTIVGALLWPNYAKRSKPKKKTSLKFNFQDTEALKASFITLLIFWVSVWCWIYFNPPMGFYIVALATSFSFLTVMSPIKPSILLIVYTLAFVLALVSYLVLPHLHGVVEFTIFIFVYSFISFYFIGLQASVFFIIALTPLNITNSMSYSFDFFLLTISFFYIFLFILLFFYYIPFSTRSESMYLKLSKAFYKNLLNIAKDTKPHPASYYNHTFSKSNEILDKQLLWISLIDKNYFDRVNVPNLYAIVEKLRYCLYLIIYIKSQNSDNQTHFQEIAIRYINQIIKTLSTNHEVSKDSIDKINQELKDKDIGLYRVVLDTLIEISQIQIQTNIQELKESRF
jgi:hypothetical protein